MRGQRRVHTELRGGEGRMQLMVSFGLSWTYLKIFFHSKCRANGIADCEDDPCLSNANMISDINRDAGNLGWKAFDYPEFQGRKLQEGLTYRLGTFVPRVRVKSMSRLSNRLETLPREFNSMNNWPSLISDVRDQGWCGWVWWKF